MLQQWLLACNDYCDIYGETEDAKPLYAAGDALAAALAAAEQRAKRAEPLEQAAIAYAALAHHGSDEQFRAAENGLTAAAIDYAVASAGGPEVQSRG
jgi:hypothetical protein